MIPVESIRAVTLDLDDTLWPVWPAIRRAEQVLHDWLRVHAPATAQAFDTEGLRQLREEARLLHPQWAHDLTALRRESIRDALQRAGDDPGLAVPAFEAFFDERQRVEFYPDVLPALARLVLRWPLLALTNGNADLHRVGLSTWMVGSVSAREFGLGKPDARIFHEACRRLDVPADAVLHIGDDRHLDIEAARSAGLHALWIHRGGDPVPTGPVGVPVCKDLLAAADLLRV